MKIYLDNYEQFIDSHNRSFIRVNENLLYGEVTVHKARIDEIIEKIKAIKIGKYEDYVIQIIEQLKKG